MENEITVRYNTSTGKFEVNLFHGHREFEAVASVLSEALTDLAEQLESYGF